MARICQHRGGCTVRIRRRGKTGPWPRFCAKHKRAYQDELRRTVYRRPRKYTEPVKCADCPATIKIPEHGKPPNRCEACAVEHRRRQTAERQRRFRERRGKAT